MLVGTCLVVTRPRSDVTTIALADLYETQEIVVTRPRSDVTTIQIDSELSGK